KRWLSQAGLLEVTTPLKSLPVPDLILTVESKTPPASASPAMTSRTNATIVPIAPRRNGLDISGTSSASRRDALDVADPIPGQRRRQPPTARTGRRRRPVRSDGLVRARC